jgi:hypothetical protein
MPLARARLKPVEELPRNAMCCEKALLNSLQKWEVASEIVVDYGIIRNIVRICKWCGHEKPATLCMAVVESKLVEMTSVRVDMIDIEEGGIQ